VKPHLKGRWIRDSTRKSIYARDGYKCGYCGRDLSSASPENIVLDHIDPEGSNDPANLKTSCKKCNDAKGGKKVVDFLREKGKNKSMPIKLPAKKVKKPKAKKPKAKAKKPMAPAAKAALLARLAKGRKAKAAKGKANKPRKDAFGIAEAEAGKAQTVSKVNKRGTAKAKRQAKAKSPRRVSTKSKPDPRGMSKVTTTKKSASNLI